MYGEFAEIYDRLQEIDYNAFIEFYQMTFEKFGINPELVLDLACGTGNVTIPMSKLGYDMIGIDISEEMLDIASEKARNENCNILFLNQDMTEFELYGTVDAIICALDGVNYLTADGDMEKLLKLVKNYLNPNGLFIFDINSEYKLKNVLGNNTFVYDEENVYCVWDNFFDEERNVCEFNLDFFVKSESGLYERKEEYQEEKVYSLSEIRNVSEKVGLDIVGVFENFDFKEPTDESERLFVVMKK